MERKLLPVIVGAYSDTFMYPHKAFIVTKAAYAVELFSVAMEAHANGYDQILVIGIGPIAYEYPIAYLTTTARPTPWPHDSYPDDWRKGTVRQSTATLVASIGAYFEEAKP